MGSVVSFFLNKHFTFRSREKGAGVVLRFALNITVCWLLAYGLAQPIMAHVLAGMALSEKLKGNPDPAGRVGPVRGPELWGTAVVRL